MSALHGNTMPSLGTACLGAEEYVVQIEGHSGGYVDGVVMYSNLGNQFGLFGGSGGTDTWGGIPWRTWQASVDLWKGWGSRPGQPVLSLCQLHSLWIEKVK